MDTALFLKVLLALVETFVYFGIGAAALGCRIITVAGIKDVSRLAILVLTPFLTYSSIAGSFHARDLTTLWQLPAAAFGMIALHAALGFAALPLLRRRTPERRATFMHLSAVNNFMFLPLIVAANLFGSKAIGALMVWSVGSTAAQWTIGIAVMSKGDWKELCRNLLSTNLLAVLLALLAVMTDFATPAPVMKICSNLGAAAIPLTLITIGASLWNSRSALLHIDFDLAFAVLCRLVLYPLATVGAILLLPLAPQVREAALIVSVMPASCGSLLIVRNYGGCPDFAGQIILYSTLASLATIPLFLQFIL